MHEPCLALVQVAARERRDVRATQHDDRHTAKSYTRRVTDRPAQSV